MVYKPIAALMALGLCRALRSARADDDVAALRAELQNLKYDYEARVAALEARIEQLESAAGRGGARSPRRSRLRETAPRRSIPRFGGPRRQLRRHFAGSRHWRIAGFMPSGGEVGPGERSFNLGESELTLSASVDPYFSAS